MWVQPKYILKLMKSKAHLLTWFSLHKYLKIWSNRSLLGICVQCLINILGPGDLILESTNPGVLLIKFKWYANLDRENDISIFLIL